MSSLEYIEQPNARAIVAPDFAAGLRELDALDSASWSAHFDASRPQGEGRRPVATPTLAAAAPPTVESRFGNDKLSP